MGAGSLSENFWDQGYVAMSSIWTSREIIDDVNLEYVLSLLISYLHRQSWEPDNSACIRCPRCCTPPLVGRRETLKARPDNDDSEWDDEDEETKR